MDIKEFSKKHLSALQDIKDLLMERTGINVEAWCKLNPEETNLADSGGERQAGGSYEGWLQPEERYGGSGSSSLGRRQAISVDLNNFFNLDSGEINKKSEAIEKNLKDKAFINLSIIIQKMERLSKANFNKQDFTESIKDEEYFSETNPDNIGALRTIVEAYVFLVERSRAYGSYTHEIIRQCPEAAQTGSFDITKRMAEMEDSQRLMVKLNDMKKDLIKQVIPHINGTPRGEDRK